MIPSQIIQVSKGYLYVKNCFFYEFSIPALIEKIEISRFKEFNASELAEIIKYMSEMNVPVTQNLLSLMLNQKCDDNVNYIYNVLHNNLDKTIIKASAENIIKNGDIEKKVKLLQAILQFNWNDIDIQLLCNNIQSNINEINIDTLLELIKLIDNEPESITFSLYNPSMLFLQNSLSLCAIKELAEIANLIGLLVHKDFAIPNEFSKAFTEVFMKNMKNLNKSNLSAFVHLFSYSLPSKIGHDLLMKYILSTNSPSIQQDKRPNHDNFYKITKNKYLILNHKIFSEMDKVNLSIILNCIKMRFQLPEEVDEIIVNYTKAVLQNSYFKLNTKFRSKIAISIAKPENFRYDLAELLFQQLEESFKRNHREIYTYSVIAYIKNFQNMGYSHPLMDKILNVVDN